MLCGTNAEGRYHITIKKYSSSLLTQYTLFRGDVQNFVGIHPTRAESLMEGLGAIFYSRLDSIYLVFGTNIYQIIKEQCWQSFPISIRVF